MKHKILFVERRRCEFVSIEKAFREIARGLNEDFEFEFQQVRYGNRFPDTIRNLLFFRKKKADIYHITGHIHYLALLFSPKNTVLSIMDVRFLYTQPGLKRWLLKKLYLDWPVRKLRYITAISEQTKSEIIRFTGCARNKIRVLELPLLVEVDVVEPTQFNGQKPTILQVGTMENKNIPNLARALRGIECKLRIIGRINADIIAVLGENHIDFENAFDLTDEQLRQEYRAADLVAFCSTYEGFGLPIIEAQSMRKPVITSNLSPMIETSGGAAVLVNPNKSQSIREGIEKVIGDVGFRAGLIEQGLQNIERFRAPMVAARYEEFYMEILGKALTVSATEGDEQVPD